MPRPKRNKPIEGSRRIALALDAWLDNALYTGWRRISSGWRRYAETINKLKVRGWKKLVLSLFDEALTLSVGVLAILAMLAIPTFRDATDKWETAPSVTATYLDRFGNEIGHRGTRFDDTVKFEDFPDILLKAVLATEDRRFYQHLGIDPIGTVRALTVNMAGGGVVQGGSTITQQLAKNLFLSNERSLDRKIREAFLALWLESHYSKTEILKLYLDRAYMGGGAHGVVAAANYYFGKKLPELTLAETAMLAGLFKAPTKFSPYVNLPAARARANDVLRNLVDAGFLNDGQIQTALRNPATPIDRKLDTAPEYYLDWAYEQTKKFVASGALGTEHVLVIKTPFDPSIQKAADQALENTLRQYGKQYRVSQGAIVIMDADGPVRAIVGGRDYGLSQFNRATDAQRQPGSSFKPFVYAAALIANPKLNPQSRVVDAPICVGNWCPSNYGRSFSGAMPMAVALARSINTVAVRLSIEAGKGNPKLGRTKVVELAHAMGLTTELKDSTSLPIGSGEVLVIDMAAAFSAFANGGYRTKPVFATEILSPTGTLIYRHDGTANAEQVLQPQVVSDMNYMLNQVTEIGTGRRARLEGIPVAGKSGTTNDYRDAWFIGFTGNMTGAVWLGNDDHSSMNNLTGGVLSAMIWHDVMEVAHRNLEIKPLLGVTPEKAQAKQQQKQAPQATLQPRVEPTPTGVLSRKSFDTLTSFRELNSKISDSANVTTGQAAGNTLAPKTAIP